MTVLNSMSTNLPGRLRNTRLPRTHGLLPLFEAVVNSVHAIEEATLTPSAGRILIEVMREPTLGLSDDPRIKAMRGSIVGFKITDNGIGFTDGNMRSFRTLDTDHKIDMGGRGVGRLLWLKAFDRIMVRSTYQDPAKQTKTRTFTFSATHGVAEQPIADAERDAERRATVHLDGFKNHYREHARKTLDAIGRHILEHCLWYFVRPGDAPRIEIHDDGEVLSLDDVYHEHMHTSASIESVEIEQWRFDLVHVRLRTNSLATHTLSWCADNRLVSEERFAGRVPGLHGRLSDRRGEFVYSCYVSSPFLNEHARPERTGLGAALFHRLLSRSFIRVYVRGHSLFSAF